MDTVKLVDALGREHAFSRPPRRIVSLVPSITETLFALGGGGALVGATDFCVHPESELAGVPRVGGTKNASVERIRPTTPQPTTASPSSFISPMSFFPSLLCELILTG